jgi:hypothetical protein
MFAIVSYILPFLLGFLLVPHFKKEPLSVSDAMVLSFFLGTSNIVLFLLIFGVLGKLSYGVYALLIEMFLLAVVNFRCRSIPRVFSFRPSLFEVVLLVLIGCGLVLRFITLFSYQPAIAWDALKFYLPWGRQFYVYDGIPLFDYSFNGGEPIGPTISFPLLISWVYWWHGSIQEIYAYTLSPIFSVMTALVLYLFASKLFNKKTAFLATIIFSFTPSLIGISSIPYVDAMLAFYVLVFFYCCFDKSAFLLGISIGMSLLTKYSAIALLPFFLLYAVIYSKTKRYIAYGFIAAAFFIVPWYLRNTIFFGNPFPFMAATVSIFENPPPSFNVLLQYGPQVHPLDPSWALQKFFLESALLPFVSRLILIFSSLYVFFSRCKNKIFLAICYWIFFFIFLFSGENDIRYLMPFYPLAILISLSFMPEVWDKRGIYVWAGLTASLHLIFSLGDTVDYTDAVSLFGNYIVFIYIVPAIYAVLQRVKWSAIKIPVFHMNLKLFAAMGLLLFIGFSQAANSHVAFATIKREVPNWQEGLTGLIEFARKMNDESYFLMVEDPGVRYYANINVYELTDAYGPIRLHDLFDSTRSIHVVFFGQEAHRLDSQSEHQLQGDFKHDSYIETQLLKGGKVQVTFADLPLQDYVLTISYAFSGRINYKDLNGDEGNLTLQPYAGWQTANYNVSFGSDVNLTIFDDESAIDSLKLRFVLISPENLYSGNYGSELGDSLRAHNIRYVIVSQVLVNVWVYTYYPMYAFLAMDNCSAIFQKLYESNFWTLYMLMEG